MDKYEKRFWAKVDKGPDDECWNWQAASQSGGYGQFWDGKRDVLAHRYVWKLANGSIPKRMCVLHHCDNRKCVNPNHLFLGTRIDNNRDMVQKNRQVKGEDNGRSKLTKDQVLKIRKIYTKENEIMQRELAEEYNVSIAQISHIVNRKSWKHI